MAADSYDPVELRGRIVVCFSAHELRAMAESLGVSGISWDRGAQEAARDLVRHFERQGALAQLVEALRRARPLVELPEPAALAEAKPGAGTELLLDSRPPPPLFDTPASPPSSKKPVPPPPRSAPAPPSRGWQQAPAPGPRTLDARILVAVAALTVLAAAIAFIAGRSSNGAGTTPTAGGSTAGAPSATPPAQRRADGPAVRAADAFARGLANVGRACELSRAEADVLRGALAQCGPRAAPTQPVVTIPPESPAVAPSASEDPDATPRVPPGGPEPALRAPGSPCVAGCDANHRACNGRCGPEPTHSSDYADHQQCLAKCLATASKCRIGCR